MRRLLLTVALMLGLAALAGGGPARAAATRGAQAGETVVVKRPLRGLQPTTKPAPKPKRAAAPLPVAYAPPRSPAPPDIGQCRLGCDQAYYFCLSADDADVCGSAWTRCRAGCARPTGAP